MWTVCRHFSSYSVTLFGKTSFYPLFGFATFKLKKFKYWIVVLELKKNQNLKQSTWSAVMMTVGWQLYLRCARLDFWSCFEPYLTVFDIKQIYQLWSSLPMYEKHMHSIFKFDIEKGLWLLWTVIKLFVLYVSQKRGATLCYHNFLVRPGLSALFWFFSPPPPLFFWYKQYRR